MAEGEHQWFTLVLGGEQEEQAPYPYYTDDSPDADFDDVDNAEVAAAFATWRSACAAARERVAAAPSLDITGSQEHTRTLLPAKIADRPRPRPLTGWSLGSRTC